MNGKMIAYIVLGFTFLICLAALAPLMPIVFLYFLAR